MKELFIEIDRIVPTMGDWCSVKKAAILASMVVALRPAVTVEIGVFSGASFLPMALAHKHLDHGVAYAIDPWNKSASIEGMYVAADITWWERLDHEQIYQDFMARVHSNGLSKHTQIIRAKSDDVEPPKDIGLFHLDGNHGQQAIKDVARFAPNVIMGGICWMDDLHWSGGGVAKAADNLIGMGFVKLYEQDTGAVFQRISK